MVTRVGEPYWLMDRWPLSDRRVIGPVLIQRLSSGVRAGPTAAVPGTQMWSVVD
jgi:hypothetical protein